MIPVLLGLFLYGLLHSILAGQDVKQRFKAILGERAYHGLYRLIYNLIAVVTLIPVIILMSQNGDHILWQFNDAWAPILSIIQAIGVIGVVVSLIQIDLGRFAGLRQLWTYLNDEALPLSEEPLQIKGLYRIVRHPLYLFSLMATWPVQVMSVGYFGWCLGVTLYFAIGSYFEEKRLLRIFGKPYADYQASVPWLIPLLRFDSKR